MCAEGMGCGRRWVIWVLYEQGLAVGVQGCLEGFHQQNSGYFSQYFVPKWDSPNAECVLAAAGTTSLLVELIGVAA